MAPKAKGKAKAKATIKKSLSKESLKSEEVDNSGIENTLRKWSEFQEQQKEASKGIEACKTEVEAYMAREATTIIKTATFSVEKRQQSRQGVSKKDLPADIWEKYAKTSEFTVLTLKAEGKAKGKK
mmetsp:Transcript_119576/g.211312  ORF Transcript_119576/g.211312 Transcript_119576/m.211312 type:complete len:126 (-) Transcript_119576:109-486(-)